jgi:hypothetical protein
MGSGRMNRLKLCSFRAHNLVEMGDLELDWDVECLRCWGGFTQVMEATAIALILTPIPLSTHIILTLTPFPLLAAIPHYIPTSHS